LTLENEDLVIHWITSLFAVTLAYPIYLVGWRNRFWFAFFVTWGLLVANQVIVTYGDRAGASDATEVGLTLFAGWLLALPFCLLLKLIRVLANRFHRSSPT